jgi:hypothetical protein
VAVVVLDVAVELLDVRAVDVVDVAVAVVVDAVAGRLARVAPEALHELGVVELDAAVEDGDEDALAVRLRPGRGRAGGLLGQAPLLAEQRVRCGLRRRGGGADGDGGPEGGE